LSLMSQVRRRYFQNTCHGSCKTLTYIYGTTDTPGFMGGTGSGGFTPVEKLTRHQPPKK
jgi:hypothetical protein